MQLELQNLTKQYGAKCAVDDINVVLRPGVYGLLGANGAGKTTLMRMICNVLKPSAGSILLNGKTAAELGESYHAAGVCFNFLICRFLQINHLQKMFYLIFSFFFIKPFHRCHIIHKFPAGKIWIKAKILRHIPQLSMIALS